MLAPFLIGILVPCYTVNTVGNIQKTNNISLHSQKKTEKKPSFSWTAIKKKIATLLKPVKRYFREHEDFLKGVGLASCILAAWQYGPGFFEWLFPYVVFRDSINVGNSVVRGNVRQEGDRTIRQVELAYQVGNTCAYHSIFNSIVLLHAHYIPNADITALRGQCTPTMNRWSQSVRQHPGYQRHAELDGTNIDGEMVQMLIAQEEVMANGLLHDLPNNRYHIEVVESVEHFRLSAQNHANHDGTVQVAQVREIIRNRNLDMYVVIINNGQSIQHPVTGQLGTTGTRMYGNHWITIACAIDRNNGSRTYTVIDSQNRDYLYQRNFVHDIIAIFEGVLQEEGIIRNQ